MSDDLVEQLRVYASISSMGSVATLFGKAADEIERLRRSPVAEGGGWLPIDSAPKDGTYVLLFDEEDGEVVIGCWGSSSTWVHVPGGWSVPSSVWAPLMAPPADWLILREEIDALARGGGRPSPPVPSQEGGGSGAQVPRPIEQGQAASTASVDRRPTTSNADEWQLWLEEHADSDRGFIAVQIVEAIEEHQKALAREVYGLAEDTTEKYEPTAKRDDVMGAFSRGRITEAKSIARAVNAIMPYSRDPSALKQAAPSQEGASEGEGEERCLPSVGENRGDRSAQ